MLARSRHRADSFVSPSPPTMTYASCPPKRRPADCAAQRCSRICDSRRRRFAHQAQMQSQPALSFSRCCSFLAHGQATFGQALFTAPKLKEILTCSGKLKRRSPSRRAVIIRRVIEVGKLPSSVGRRPGGITRCAGSRQLASSTAKEKDCDQCSVPESIGSRAELRKDAHALC